MSVSFASATCRSRALAARSAATSSGTGGTSGTTRNAPQPAHRSQHDTHGRHTVTGSHRPPANPWAPIQLHDSQPLYLATLGKLKIRRRSVDSDYRTVPTGT